MLSRNSLVLVLLLASTPVAARTSTQQLQVISTDVTQGFLSQPYPSGGGSQSGEVADGTPTCDTTSSDDDGWHYSLHCAKSFGNDEWGADYDGLMQLNANSNALRAWAGFEANARAFGKATNLIDAGVDIASTQQGQSGTAWIYGLGKQIWGDSVHQSIEWTPSPWSKKFGITMVIPITGIISVNITGGVAGELGVKAGVTLATKVAGKVTPYGMFSGYVTASVGIAGGAVAEVGFKIALGLLRADVPFTGSLELTNSGTLKFALDADLKLQTLSGKFSVFWDALFGLVGDEYVITEWKGIEKQFSLLHKSAEIDL